MAIGKVSDFVIYQPEFYGAMSEVLAQSVAPLASVGISQQVRPIAGHYERRALIEAISGIVSRRDLTSVAAATDAAVPMDEDVSVKLNRKIGPVAQTLDSWRKAGLRVDGLVADPLRGHVGIHLLESAGNLLRRPAALQRGLDLARHGRAG